MQRQVEFKLKLYCCPSVECLKEYKSKFNLRKHFQMCHLGKTFHECRICKKHFASQQILREHIYRHSGAKPYKCHLCGNKYRQYSHLSLHRRQHNLRYLNALEVEELQTESELEEMN